MFICSCKRSTSISLCDYRYHLFRHQLIKNVDKKVLNLTWRRIQFNFTTVFVPRVHRKLVQRDETLIDSCDTGNDQFPPLSKLTRFCSWCCFGVYVFSCYFRHEVRSVLCRNIVFLSQFPGTGWITTWGGWIQSNLGLRLLSFSVVELNWTTRGGNFLLATHTSYGLGLSFLLKLSNIPSRQSSVILFNSLSSNRISDCKFISEQWT